MPSTRIISFCNRKEAPPRRRVQEKEGEMNKWTTEQVQVLKEGYSIGNPSSKKLSELIGRTRRSILTKAAELGLTQPNTLKEEEKTFIRENAETHSILWLAQALKRTEFTVRKFCISIGISKCRDITDKEREFLVQNAPNHGVSWMAREMNRSSNFIRKEAVKLGVKFKNENVWDLTESDIEIMKSSSHLTAMEIGELFNRSSITVRKKMRGLGLSFQRYKKRYPNKQKRVRIRNRSPKVKPVSEVPRVVDGESRIREAMKRLGYA